MLRVTTKFAWATSPAEHENDNPIVSVDYEGKVLSRLNDVDWVYPGPRRTPRARATIRWPGSSKNVMDAKELVLLRLSHGTALGCIAAQAVTRALSALAEYCESKGVTVRDLHRFPNVVVDFCMERTSAERISRIASIGRVAYAHRQSLGWTFLEPEQIQALDAIQTMEEHQHPVIPHRIHAAVDRVADEIVEGYLAISADVEEVCVEWAAAGTHLRKPGKPSNWDALMERHPKVGAFWERWGGEGTKRIGVLINAVRRASLWIIGGGSSARIGEIFSLERGCVTEELIGEERCYLMHAGTTKTQVNPNAIWIVSPKVENAARALEAVLDLYERIHPNPPGLSKYLFQNLDLTLGEKTHRAQRKGRKFHGDVVRDLRFKPMLVAAGAVISVDDLNEAKRLTPSLNEDKFRVGRVWPASPHQLRRTVFVRAAASGMVSQDSLSFQAKHKAWKMTAYYCQYYWELANTDPENPLLRGTSREEALEFSRVFADSYNSDREQILRDDRFISPYGSEHKRNTIASVPLLSVSEIQAGKRARVLKRNTLGLCCEAEFCEWQKAETVRGCLTKQDGEPCSKAIIDVERLIPLKAIREDLEYRLESVPTRDQFEREELAADIAATDRAISMIETSVGGGDD